MLEHEQQAYSIRYKFKHMQVMIDQTKRIIEQAVNIEGTNCIGISGGKDCLVVFDILSKFIGKAGIDCFWGDDGWDFPETLDYLKVFEDYYQVKINRVNSVGIQAKFEREVGHKVGYGNDGTIHDYEYHSLSKLNPYLGYSKVFLGLRKEESRERRIFLNQCGGVYFNKAEKLWKINPIADWSTDDVWTYITGNELPYNKVYNKTAELGIPIKFRRVGPLTATKVWQYGAMVTLKRGWPELYNRFSQQVPEVREYI